MALVGLLSTVGAAALGGYFVNKSVERQLESERSAKIQDQRREVYVDYLRATTQACNAQEAGDKTKVDATAVEVLNQHGRVLLIAGPALRDAVSKFTDAIIDGSGCASNKNYFARRDAFIEAAKHDLE